MNDFENEIFTAVAAAARKEHSGVNAVGEYVRKPSHFPTLAVSEIENVMIDSTMDSSGEEIYSGLSYRVQTFSNKKSGKKAEAKAIFATADRVMQGFGFRRKTYTTTPEIYDSTIYSVSATYEAIVDADGVVYKR